MEFLKSHLALIVGLALDTVALITVVVMWLSGRSARAAARLYRKRSEAEDVTFRAISSPVDDVDSSMEELRRRIERQYWEQSAEARKAYDYDPSSIELASAERRKSLLDEAEPPSQDDEAQDEDAQTQIPAQEETAEEPDVLESSLTGEEGIALEHTTFPPGASTRFFTNDLLSHGFGFGGRVSDAALNFPPLWRPPDDINFRAFAPREAAPGDDIFVNLVIEKADEPVADVESEFGIAGSLVATQTAKARRNDRIEVELIQPDCEIEEALIETEWSGRAENIRFLVRTPALEAPKKLTFRLAIRINGVPVRRLLFQMDCKPGAQATATPDLSEMQLERYTRAFISYSSKDAAFARVVAIALEAAGIDPFIDAHGLRSGDDWKDRLLETIRGSDLFLLCWSDNAAASDMVGIEIETAADQQGLPPGFRPDIAPIAVSTPFPNLPSAISHLHVGRRFALTI